jgi:5-methylthioadenosine/S-adenosylhomocysteine deaminase
MHHIDTLIFAGWIVPVEPEDTIYEHYALAIHEGKILALLPSSEAVSQFSARITYRLSNHLLIPGLINTHTHAAMCLLRGFADDMPLQDWLSRRIWPIEQALVSREFVADGTKLAMVEMLRGGVTCFNDMYFFPDVVGEIAEQVGIRATVGLILLDFPTAWAKWTANKRGDTKPKRCKRANGRSPYCATESSTSPNVSCTWIWISKSNSSAICRVDSNKLSDTV